MSISKRNQGNGRSKYRSSNLEFSVTLSLFIIEIFSMEMSESVERKVNFADSEFNCIIGASTLHLPLCGSLRHSEHAMSLNSRSREELSSRERECESSFSGISEVVERWTRSRGDHLFSSLSTRCLQKLNISKGRFKLTANVFDRGALRALFYTLICTLLRSSNEEIGNQPRYDLLRTAKICSDLRRIVRGRINGAKEGSS